MTGYLFNINQDSNFTRHSIHGWILGLGRDLTHSIHIGCEPYQAFYPGGNGAIILAANWLQHEPDCSCWTYSEVRNAQNFTLIPIHAFSLVLWFKKYYHRFVQYWHKNQVQWKTHVTPWRNIQFMQVSDSKYHLCIIVTALMNVTHWYSECGSSLYKHSETRFMYSGSWNI
jgi:hypothetical protein